MDGKIPPDTPVSMHAVGNRLPIPPERDRSAADRKRGAGTGDRGAYAASWETLVYRPANAREEDEIELTGEQGAFGHIGRLRSEDGEGREFVFKIFPVNKVVTFDKADKVASREYEKIARIWEAARNRGLEPTHIPKAYSHGSVFREANEYAVGCAVKMSKVPGEPLADMIQSLSGGMGRNVSAEMALRLGYALLEPVRELGDVAHGDPHSRNFLIELDDSHGVLEAYLVDFGLAVGIPGVYATPTRDRSAQGSSYVSAPELLQGGKRYAEWKDKGASNVWAVGALIAWAYTGHYPVEEQCNAYRKGAIGSQDLARAKEEHAFSSLNFPKTTDGSAASVEKLIEILLTAEPEDRLSLLEDFEKAGPGQTTPQQDVQTERMGNQDGRSGGRSDAAHPVCQNGNQVEVSGCDHLRRRAPDGTFHEGGYGAPARLATDTSPLREGKSQKWASGASSPSLAGQIGATRANSGTGGLSSDDKNVLSAVASESPFSTPLAVLYEDGTLTLGTQDVASLSVKRDGIKGIWNLGNERCSEIRPDTGTNPESFTPPWKNQALSVTSVEVVSPLSPSSTVAWFAGFKKCLSFNLDHLDLSWTSRADYMFAECSQVSEINIKINDLNSPICTDYMFSGCSSLKSLDILSERETAIPDEWHIIWLESASHMFSGCSSLSSLDVSRWGMGSIEDASAMFQGCSSLSSLDVSRWGMWALEDASAMFQGCSSLSSLDVSRWFMHSLEDASYMFCGCSSLYRLYASGWDMRALKNAKYMFCGCSSLSRLYASGWDMRALEDASYMFYGCSSLSLLDASGWKMSSLKNSDMMFYGCSLLSGLGRARHFN